jgi:hypothetical protein
VLDAGGVLRSEEPDAEQRRHVLLDELLEVLLECHGAARQFLSRARSDPEQFEVTHVKSDSPIGFDFSVGSTWAPHLAGVVLNGERSDLWYSMGVASCGDQEMD